MNSPSRWLRPLLLACLLSLVAAAVALGHAELEESDPPDGGSIDQTPYTMVARFGPDALDATRSRIVVRNSANQVVAEGAVTEDDEFTMAVDLPALPPGSYIARWTAVGSDGHIERGNIAFTITQPPATPSPPPTPTAAPTPTTTGPAGPTALPEPTPIGSPLPTATALPTPSPTPTATPAPQPGDDEPAATEILVGLLVAGGLIGALMYFLLRRRGT